MSISTCSKVDWLDCKKTELSIFWFRFGSWLHTVVLSFHKTELSKGLKVSNIQHTVSEKGWVFLLVASPGNNLQLCSKGTREDWGPASQKTMLGAFSWGKQVQACSTGPWTDTFHQEPLLHPAPHLADVKLLFCTRMIAEKKSILVEVWKTLIYYSLWSFIMILQEIWMIKKINSFIQWFCVTVWW